MSGLIEKTCTKIEKLDEKAMQTVASRWNDVAKPLHSLGLLEDIVIRVAGITRDASFKADPKALVVFCADNGVVEEGVGYTVYGYSSPLGSDESTEALMPSVTLRNMSASDFRAMDVNIEMTGYLADTEEDGTDIEVAWNRIKNGN